MITPFIAAWRLRHPENAGTVLFDSETPFLGVYTPPGLPLASEDRGRKYVYVVDFASLSHRDYIMLTAISTLSDEKWRYKLNDEPWSPVIQYNSRVYVGKKDPIGSDRILAGMNELRVLEYDAQNDFWPQIEDAQVIRFESDVTAVHDPLLEYAQQVALVNIYNGANDCGPRATGITNGDLVAAMDCNRVMTELGNIPADTVVPIGDDSDDWYEVVPIDANATPLRAGIPLVFESYPPSWPSA